VAFCTPICIARAASALTLCPSRTGWHWTRVKATLKEVAAARTAAATPAGGPAWRIGGPEMRSPAPLRRARQGVSRFGASVHRKRIELRNVPCAPYIYDSRLGRKGLGHASCARWEAGPDTLPGRNNPLRRYSTAVSREHAASLAASRQPRRSVSELHHGQRFSLGSR
jgi:hypothetical protein